MPQIKKLTILFCSLCLAVSIQAQSKKFKLGIHLYPNYSYGIIVNDGTGPDWLEESMRDREQKKLSYSANAFVEYVFNATSSAGIGLGYRNVGTKTKIFTYTYIPQPPPGAPIQGQFRYDHYAIEVPLFYRFSFNKFFYSVIGVSNIFNVHNTITSIIYYDDGIVERNTEEYQPYEVDFRKYKLAGNFGIGFNYLVRDNFKLFIQPNVQYDLMGITEPVSLNRQFVSGGLCLGVVF